MWIVEELESSIDIVQLVSRYTKLRKSGANFKAVCPFPGHNEKTPSFMVSPSKQLAYCFWCHKWWWALKFIMDIENIEFKEALQILAEFAGKKLEWYNFKENKIQKNMYSLYRDATSYYKQALKNNPEIIKYLYERWLKNEDIEKFNFWYADSGVWLYNYLKEKWYEDSLILDSKIFVDLRNRKDKFIWRIIFPIQNLRWDFVAFTARIVWKGEPKYLNSPATPWFDKSAILYGLYQAKSEIVKKDFVIITEWQMDTISMHSHWFTNTVAISWTALTEKHLTIIKRLTHKVFLCFDGDSAWTKATKLALETIKNKDLEVKIINLWEWKDPDDLLKSGEDFQKYIDNALSPIWYYIEKSDFNLNSIEDKKKLLVELLQIIKSFSDPIEKDFYLKEISKKLNITESLVYDAFNRLKLERTKTTTQTKPIINSEEMAIWFLLLENQEYTEILEQNIIFKEAISKDLQLILENSKNIDSFPLDKKEKYKAISMKIEIENQEKTPENILEEIKKIAQKINIESYKKITEKLKEKMSQWDDNAFLQYTEIIKTAKKYGIK